MAYETSRDDYVAVRESVMKLEIKKERGEVYEPEFSWNLLDRLRSYTSSYKAFFDIIDIL